MRRPLSLLITLAWLLNGCTGWKTQEVTPSSYIESQHPAKVRLTLQDSAQVTLNSPSVVRDSIVGAVSGDSVPHAFAVSDVHAIEAREGSSEKTVWLVFGIVAALAAAAVLVYAAVSSGLGD